MKVSGIIGCVFFLSVVIVSCDKNKKADHQEDIQEAIELNPATETYNEAFPFNEAAYIEVISYENRRNWDDQYWQEVKVEDNYETSFVPTSIIADGNLRIEESNIEERVKLSKSREKELHEILYNDSCLEEEIVSCYEPRHAIIFYDTADSAFAAIEFCLQCKNYIATEDTKGFELCPLKVKSLSEFFEAEGISAGIRP